MLHNRSNSTPLIDKLIDMKYVKIFKDKDDKSMIHYEITTNGLLLLDEIDPLINAHCKDTIQLNSTKLKQLSDLLEDLIHIV